MALIENLKFKDVFLKMPLMQTPSHDTLDVCLLRTFLYIRKQLLVYETSELNELIFYGER
jgi:hypothetical protein